MKPITPAANCFSAKQNNLPGQVPPLESQAFSAVLQAHESDFDYSDAIDFPPLTNCRVSLTTLAALPLPLQARAGIVNASAREAFTCPPPPLNVATSVTGLQAAPAVINKLEALREAARREMRAVDRSLASEDNDDLSRAFDAFDNHLCSAIVQWAAVTPNFCRARSAYQSASGSVDMPWRQRSETSKRYFDEKKRILSRLK